MKKRLLEVAYENVRRIEGRVTNKMSLEILCGKILHKLYELGEYENYPIDVDAKLFG